MQCGTAGNSFARRLRVAVTGDTVMIEQTLRGLGYDLAVYDRIDVGLVNALARADRDRAHVTVICVPSEAFARRTLRAVAKYRATPPLIVLTRDSNPVFRTQLFRAGADAVADLPLSSAEICLRIGAVIRRGPRVDANKRSDAVAFGPYRFEFANSQLYRGGQFISLSPRQRRVLRALARRVGRVVSRDQLWIESLPLTLPWHRNADARAADRDVCALRRIIEINPVRPRYLLTVHTIGYRLECTPVAAAGDGQMTPCS